MSSYEYKDNTKQVLSALEKAKRRGLEAIGLTAEGYAKETITKADAVYTGRLRNSITFAIGGEPSNISAYSGDNGEEGGTYSGNAPKEKNMVVYIGTNVNYAKGIETGSHIKKGAVHFLKRAATEHTAEYKKLLEDSMKNG